MLEIRFVAREQLEIEIQEMIIPINLYLLQSQRLVKLIADPILVEVLGQERYRLKIKPINFMDLYHFQPTVVLKIWSQPEGTVYLESEESEILGNDYINERFSLNLKGQLDAQGNHLKGVVDLEVKVDLPPALWLTPKYLLEVAGNRLAKSILGRIKQKLSSQLLEDYYLWCQDIQYQQAFQEDPTFLTGAKEQRC